MDKMIYYDQITQSLSESLHYGSSTLADIPNLVKQVLEKKMWKERVVRATGQLVKFDYFADYVTAREPEGLGGNVGQLRAICRDRQDVLTLIDNEIKAHNSHGTNRFSRVDTSTLEKRTIKEQGVKPGTTGRPYNVSVLKAKSAEAVKAGDKKQAKLLDRLASQLSSGKITVEKARIQAGLPVDDRIKIPRANPQRAAEMIVEGMLRDNLEVLIDLLLEAFHKEQVT